MTRKNNISLLRLICTLSIFIFHIYFVFLPNTNVFYILLSFGVQALCVISGLLYSQKEIKDIKEFYKKNLLKLIVPTIITIMLVLLLNVITLVIKNNFSWQNLYDGLFAIRPSRGTLLFQLANLWFIPFLSICYLILPLLQKTYNHKSFKYISAIIILAEIIIAKTPVVTPFVIGFIYGKNKFNIYSDKKINLKEIFIWLFLTIICCSLFILNYNINASNQLYSMLHNVLSQYFQSVTGISIAFLILSLFKFINKTKTFNGVFKFTDKVSFHIYLIHQALMIGTLSIWEVTRNVYLNSLIIFTETLLLALIINFITIVILKRIK